MSEYCYSVGAEFTVSTTLTDMIHKHHNAHREIDILN